MSQLTNRYYLWIGVASTILAVNHLLVDVLTGWHLPAHASHNPEPLTHKIASCTHRNAQGAEEKGGMAGRKSAGIECL
jgi:hypothetical protein